MPYECLRLEFDDRIASLTLAGPDAGNAIDARLLAELSQAAGEIAARDDVSVVLLAADGADFCAGWADDAVALRLQADAPADPFGAVADLPCPVIAAMQGRVRDGGLELALAADIRIAADDASFAIAALAGGMLPLAGGSQRLPRVVGRARATSMLLLGDVLDAQEAYRAGLVSRLLPRATFEVEALAVARTLASRGPLALRYAKEAVRQGLDMPLDQALRLELDFSIILQTTSDRAEGVQAFLEKRRPDFEGH